MDDGTEKPLLTRSSKTPKPPKLTKACVQCHGRKVKCDAPVVGLPCSRCISKGCSAACELPTRQRRRRTIPKVSESLESTPDSRNAHSTDNSSIAQALQHPGFLNPAAQAQSGSFRVQHVEQPTQTPESSNLSQPFQQIEVDTGREGETHVRVCREMAMGDGVPSPDKILNAMSPGRDVVEYHNGLNLLSILSEVVSSDRRRQLTRIVVDDKIVYTGVIESLPEPSDSRAELAGLDAASKEFLVKKGVFDFPPKPCIDTLLKCYFDLVYPYYPVFNRVEFMQSYESGHYSAFLLHSILAIAALYAPTDTLLASGFTERSQAQESFFSKATTLYDFRCERSQLRMLQGSLILSSTVFSYTLDKDFRYWHFNSIRLAVKMGLHKKDIIHDMDPVTYRLCKRIWWVVYSKDVLLSFMGLLNMRMLSSPICDTPPLTEDEWDDEVIPVQFQSILVPITQQKKLYFLENCKLAVIASRCLTMLKDHREGRPADLDYPFDAWRESLPETLKLGHSQRAKDDIWHTVLLATSYRFECILFRLLRTWWQTKDTESHAWAKQRLRTSMFELDTIIRRVVANNSLDKYPLVFKSCVCVVLALYIEVALDNSETDLIKSMACVHIRQGMLLLRQLQDFPSIQRTLLVFEWVLTQKGVLSADGLAGPAPHPQNQQVDAFTKHDMRPDMLPLLATQDVPRDSGQWFEEFLGFDFLDSLELPGF